MLPGGAPCCCRRESPLAAGQQKSEPPSTLTFAPVKRPGEEVAAFAENLRGLADALQPHTRAWLTPAAYLSLSVGAVSIAPASLLGQIVFISNRTSDPPAPTSGPVTPGSGGYELWAMNPDGSDRRQLTSDGAGNAQPSLSPDGTRIAWIVGDSAVSVAMRKYPLVAR